MNLKIHTEIYRFGQWYPVTAECWVTRDNDEPDVGYYADFDVEVTQISRDDLTEQEIADIVVEAKIKAEGEYCDYLAELKADY